MATLLVEHTVTCPQCWEPHAVTIDLTDEARSFVEDCHVCCNPMQVSFDVAGDTLARVDVEPAT